MEKVGGLVRPGIRYEIDRRILQPMATKKFGWAGGGNPEAKVNNWAPWIISNYRTAALLMEDKADARVADVSRGIKVIDQYIDGLGEDGGCEEGPTYWTAAVGCVYDALNLLYDATGGKLNVYHEPFIQKMGAYIYKTHIAVKYFINLADAHPEFIPDGLMLYRFGKDMNDPVMMQFGSWSWHVLAAERATMEIFYRTRSLYKFTSPVARAAYSAKTGAVVPNLLSSLQRYA